MNSFDQLLAPLKVNDFLQQYWNRRPLHVGDNQSKFADLPSLKDLPSMLSGKLSADRWVKGHAHNAQATFIDRSGRVRRISAASTMWPDLFNAGISLGFSALDQYHDELTQLVKGIAATTRLPGLIVTTCYLTPPFSGSAMHFDQQHVFFMQVSGKKNWKIAQRTAWQDAPMNIQASALAAPGMKAFFESIGVVVPSPEETDLQQITLQTGDVLYLPPGFWHEGHTSDSHSLHYTLTFMPLGPWNLLVAYLRQGLFQKLSLRRDLRYVTESGEGNVTKLVEDAIADLKNTVNSLTAADLERFFVETTSAGGPIRDQLIQM